MPPKRKKPTPDTAAIKDEPPPPPPARALRRSSRNRSINDVEKVTEPGLSLRPCPNPESDMISTVHLADAEREIWQCQDGVRRARKELSEMEERLQTEVKRQRLAIENSNLDLKGQPPEYEACHPLPVKGLSNGLVNRVPTNGDMQGVEPAVEELEAAPMSNDAAKEVAEWLEEDAEDGDPDEESEAFQLAANRPPAVNSDYLPLPWKGRLGYACLNTYLRAAKPPVFSSRTCRIASIIQHQHPLMHPSQAEHPQNNPPDKTKPKNFRLGQEFVESLGLANARDIVKMVRWNDKYGIKFMRLSSEMFPFASHETYGYSLAPFASEVLAEAGAAAAELGHRLTTHPGQFTQLGSPRKEVVKAAVRDLEYHDELLSLLKLPEQQNRDAIMILHMGGTFGDKEETMDRFRENYAKLSPSVKRRLVLENDDMSWSVHDLLPICEELDIPLVLDLHHHNIIFDSNQLREGTKDIVDLFPRIRATWTRKGITQKMHYSESCPGAVKSRDRRKHSPRVKTLPPCPADMDLMIEAKDKEQAVFELMRTFKLPGYEKLADMVPYEREDQAKLERAPAKGKGKGKKGASKKGKVKAEGETETVEVKEEDDQPMLTEEVSPDDFGMGGPLGRVYWPEGMEEWLKPKKRPVNRNKSTKLLEKEE